MNQKYTCIHEALGIYDKKTNNQTKEKRGPINDMKCTSKV